MRRDVCLLRRLLGWGVSFLQCQSLRRLLGWRDVADVATPGVTDLQPLHPSSSAALGCRPVANMTQVFCKGSAPVFLSPKLALDAEMRV